MITVDLEVELSMDQYSVTLQHAFDEISVKEETLQVMHRLSTVCAANLPLAGLDPRQA